MAGVSLTTAQRKDLEAILAMAQRSGSPMLVVAATRFEKAIEKRQRSPEVLPGQFALWEEDGSPWRGRLGADTPVRCDRMSTPEHPCVIPLKTCLQRQDAVWPGKKAKIHEYCGSGKCAQGDEYRLRTAYSAAEDWASKSKNGRPTYQAYRKDAGVQRKRMKQHDLERLGQGRAEPTSPAAEVADLDPTDEVREITGSKG
jgi:hypothetical protein